MIRSKHPVPVSFPTVRRTLTTRHRGRSQGELALAQRMLDLLRADADIRMAHVAAAQSAIANDQLDTPDKLDLALDRLIDQLEDDPT